MSTIVAWQLLADNRTSYGRPGSCLPRRELPTFVAVVLWQFLAKNILRWSPGSCLPRREMCMIGAWQLLAAKTTENGWRLAVACREQNVLRSSPGSCLPRRVRSYGRRLAVACREENVLTVVDWQLLAEKRTFLRSSPGSCLPRRERSYSRRLAFA